MCVLCDFVLYSRVSLSACPFLDILHCLPRAVGVLLESALNLVSRMSPCRVILKRQLHTDSTLYMLHSIHIPYLCGNPYGAVILERIWGLGSVWSCGERRGAGVETQKNVRGEIGGWGRVPFNETYAPSLSTIYDGA